MDPVESIRHEIVPDMKVQCHRDGFMRLQYVYLVVLHSTTQFSDVVNVIFRMFYL
jgi:hypothetical protein